MTTLDQCNAATLHEAFVKKMAGKMKPRIIEIFATRNLVPGDTLTVSFDMNFAVVATFDDEGRICLETR